MYFLYSYKSKIKLQVWLKVTKYAEYKRNDQSLSDSGDTTFL